MSDERTQIEERGALLGIEFDAEACDLAFKASPAVREWVKGANKDLGRAARIGQLFALGDTGAKARDLLRKQIQSGEVADAIATLGPPEQRLPRLRVLVDLHLDQLEVGGEVALLASSAGELHSGNGAAMWTKFAGTIDGRLDAEVAIEWPSLSKGTSKPTPLPLVAEGTPEVDQWIANPTHAPSAQAGIRSVIDQFETHHEALEALRRDYGTLGDELKSTQASLTGHLRTGVALQRLLWWGQAKYSTTLRQPYRRMNSDALRMVVAANEAAHHARSLPVEPSAAYVVETLRSLNVDPAQRRPLLGWLAETVETLQGVALRDQLKLCPALSKLANDAPFGLAAAWCVLHAHEGRPDPSKISEALGLDLSVEIDCGQWASWLFREFQLNARLQGA